ncbi:bifunctional TH2 protein, mitochondrial-like isoform X3 [Musa acuminata AAA Group]|uniref:bifunctional TH2 protein, mitochondrial-like isoform X3 n=1 Tax=Musa acuminata AAA Group TaxID=214697 RepID=UPI0031D0D5CD
MATAAGEGSAARRFWIGSKKESVFASYTPFMVCLAAGKLDMDTFRNFIAQDVFFLRAFSHAYEMAEECSDDDDAKAAINELRKAVLDKLKVYDSVVQEWGIDPTKEIIPNPATLKYTEFLLATADGKIEGGKGAGKIVTPFEKTKVAAYTVGAMTPCIRLYAFLGKELQFHMQYEGNGHPYKKWVDTYSSASFEARASQIEELLDKLSVSLTGEELEIIEKLYHRAMELEIEFYNAQPIVQPVVVPFTKLHEAANHLAFFSDFDLTCTVLDSSAILAEIAILSAFKAGQSGTDNLSAQRLPSDMRNSWDALSRQYTEEHEQCIESLLPSEQVGCTDDLSIHSNEFDYEESVSTGEIVRTMESPMDKVKTFRSILANLSSEKKHLSVYIGDSVGDLLCLLEADVGIVIGSSISLRRVGEQFGVSFVPLFPGLIRKQREVPSEDSLVWNGLSGVLYTASSWTEIHAFLFGA